MSVVNLKSWYLSDHSRHKIVSGKISLDYNRDNVARILKVCESNDLKTNFENIHKYSETIKGNDLYFHFIAFSTGETNSLPSSLSGFPYFAKC